VKALSRWLSNKSSLTLMELLKIWKGLFYCMWLSDKPLVQQELALQLSKLVHKLSKDKVLLFLSAFHQIMDTEWISIDKLRVDKFYMLMRYLLFESFKYLENLHWEEELLQNFNSMLESTFLQVGGGQKGIKYHIMDIFLEELHKINGNELSSTILHKLLHPFYLIIAKEQDKQLVIRARNSIFVSLLTIWRKKIDHESESDESDQELEPEPFFIVPFVTIERTLFEWASSKDCYENNRIGLYELKKQFHEVTVEEENIQPQ